MPLQNLLILRNIVILSAIIILNDLVQPPPHAVSGAVNITTLFGNMSFAVLPPDFECLAYESHAQRPYVSVEIHPFPSPFSTGTPLVWARDWAPRFPIRGQGSRGGGGQAQARPAPLPPPPLAIGGPSFSSSSYSPTWSDSSFPSSSSPISHRPIGGARSKRPPATMIYRNWSLLSSTVVIWGGVATAGLAGIFLFGGKVPRHASPSPTLPNPP